MRAIFAFIVVIAVVASVASSPLPGKDGKLLDLDLGKLVDIDLGIPKLSKKHHSPATTPRADDCDDSDDSDDSEEGNIGPGPGKSIPEITTKKDLIDIDVGHIIDIGVGLPILGGKKH